MRCEVIVRRRDSPNGGPGRSMSVAMDAVSMDDALEQAKAVLRLRDFRASYPVFPKYIPKAPPKYPVPRAPEDPNMPRKKNVPQAPRMEERAPINMDYLGVEVIRDRIRTEVAVARGDGLLIRKPVTVQPDPFDNLEI